uniref:Uncharacterized protein n=1 Tax=Meloidogyne incognita TaxID=6306 RepID=A0A914L970_MELIC
MSLVIGKIVDGIEESAVDPEVEHSCILHQCTGSAPWTKGSGLGENNKDNAVN